MTRTVTMVVLALTSSSLPLHAGTRFGVVDCTKTGQAGNFWDVSRFLWKSLPDVALQAIG